jgi:hypothetical protein
MNRLPEVRRRTRRAAMIVAGMAALAGCRGGAEGLSQASRAQQQARDAAAAEAAAAQVTNDTDSAARVSGRLTAPANSPPQVLSFTVSEAGFTGPDSVLNGPVEIRLTNHGRMAHEIRFLRLPQGISVADAIAFIAQRGILPPQLMPQGGVGPVRPGASGTLIEPMRDGTYLIVCTLLDPEGHPWFTKGLVSSITLTGKSPTTLQPANLRATSALSTGDVAWRFSKALTRGENRTLALEGRQRNTAIPRGEMLMMIEHFGGPGHDAVLIRAEGPRAMDDYVSWMLGDIPTSPEVISGMPGLLNGVRAYLKLNLQPGSYIIFCPHPKRGGDPNTRGYQVGEYDQFVVK